MNVLQVIAWTAMLFDYSQDNSVSEAIDMTFSGDHPCPLCCAIAEAKEESSEQPLAPNEQDRKDYKPYELFPSKTNWSLKAVSLSSQSDPRGSSAPFSLCEFISDLPTPPPRQSLA